MTSLTFFDALLAGIDVLSRMSKLLDDGQYQTFQGGGASSIVQSAICGLGSTAIEFGYGAGTPESLSTLITSVNEATRVYIMNGMPLFWTKLTVKDLAMIGSAMSNFLLASLGQPPSQNYMQTIPYALSKLASELTPPNTMSVLLSQCARRKIPNTRPMGVVPIDLYKELTDAEFYTSTNENSIYVVGANCLRFRFVTAAAEVSSNIAIPDILKKCHVLYPYISVSSTNAHSSRNYTWNITGQHIPIHSSRSNVTIANAENVTLNGLPNNAVTTTDVVLSGLFSKSGCDATKYDNLASFRDVHLVMLQPLAVMLKQTRDIYMSMMMPRMLNTWFEYVVEYARRNGDGDYPVRDRTPEQYLDMDGMIIMINTMVVGHNEQSTKSAMIEWYIGSMMLLVLASFNISYN